MVVRKLTGEFSKPGLSGANPQRYLPFFFFFKYLGQFSCASVLGTVGLLQPRSPRGMGGLEGHGSVLPTTA